jgi:hypothetical protein
MQKGDRHCQLYASQMRKQHRPNWRLTGSIIGEVLAEKRYFWSAPMRFGADQGRWVMIGQWWCWWQGNCLLPAAAAVVLKMMAINDNDMMTTACTQKVSAQLHKQSLERNCSQWWESGRWHVILLRRLSQSTWCGLWYSTAAGAVVFVSFKISTKFCKRNASFNYFSMTQSLEICAETSLLFDSASLKSRVTVIQLASRAGERGSVGSVRY